MSRVEEGGQLASVRIAVCYLIRLRSAVGAGHGSVLRVPKLGKHRVIVAAEGPHLWCQL